jgi:hypothetical protein
VQIKNLSLEGKAIPEFLKTTVWKNKSGLVLTARSTAIREWFWDLRDREHPYQDVPRWGFRVFRLPELAYPNVADVDFIRAGDALLLDHIVNLSWLRAENLHEGIEIKQQGVFLNSYIENLREAINRGVSELYREYMRPCRFQTTIDIGTVFEE